MWDFVISVTCQLMDVITRCILISTVSFFFWWLCIYFAKDLLHLDEGAIKTLGVINGAHRAAIVSSLVVLRSKSRLKRWWQWPPYHSSIHYVFSLLLSRITSIINSKNLYLIRYSMVGLVLIPDSIHFSCSLNFLNDRIQTIINVNITILLKI